MKAGHRLSIPRLQETYPTPPFRATLVPRSRLASLASLGSVEQMAWQAAAVMAMRIMR